MVQLLHVTLQLPPPLTFIDPVRHRIIVLVPQSPSIQAMTTLKVTVWRQFTPQDWKSERPGGQRYLTANIQQPSADVSRAQAKSGIWSPGSPRCSLSPLTHQADHADGEPDFWWPTIIQFQAVSVTARYNTVTYCFFIYRYTVYVLYMYYIYTYIDCIYIFSSNWK